MFVRDLKQDLYALLPGHRVLLLVNHDVDAICACKILQSLFRCDNIAYTISAVRGVEDLKNAYLDNREELKYAILLNCGGTLDLVEILQPDEGVVFFVIDSHKPTDICNVYSDSQVRVLWSESDDTVPNFEEIFRDDEDESESEDDNEDEVEETRMERMQRKAEETARKRRDRRLWEENRDKLMFAYTQFSYYGRSSAVILYELAWKLSKDNTDMLWWAIVGTTEQIMLEKVEHSHYVLETGALESHVSRLTFNNQEHQKTPTCVSITLEKDVRLPLYRHWNIESSLKYSIYTASKLRLWTLSGDKKLHQLLVDMGLPLVQARQMYNSMDLQLRKEFLPSLERLANKYALDDITFISFTLKHGYRNRYSATDVVYALLAILEHGVDSSSDMNRNFQDALDALSRCHDDVLRKGIDISKKVLESAGRYIQAFMESHQVVNAGPFLYLLLAESTSEKWVFGQPHWLGILARWTLNCHRRKSLPLLIAAPLVSGACLLLGVPPLADDTTRNLFGKAFEQAAIKSGSMVSLDFFDTSVIMLQTQDINKFLDALTSLMG